MLRRVEHNTFAGRQKAVYDYMAILKGFFVRHTGDVLRLYPVQAEQRRQ